MINFASAGVFILLPLPWLLRYFMPSAQPKNTSALKVPFYQALAKVISKRNSRYHYFHWSHLIAYLIWILLVIAASGPQIVGKAIPLSRSGRNIMLAIDLSQSMTLPDFTLQRQRVRRIDVVKEVATHFISEREGDRIGLILFGTKAYVRTPLTFDLKTVKNALNDSTIGLAGGMTAIGDAVALAVKRLQQYPKKSRVLILLTDGMSNVGHIDPLKAAELAANAGIKIYTIGIGGEGVMVPTYFGMQMINASNDLDEQTLKSIAHLTEGKFFRAKNTQALQQIYQKINQLEPSLSKNLTYRPITPLYFWPLLLAFLLSVVVMLGKFYSSWGYISSR